MAQEQSGKRDNRSPGPAKGRPRKSAQMTSARALGIGLELGASVGGMAVVGYLLDGYFDTAPWLALSFTAAGLIGGVYNVIREVMRIGR